MTLTDLERQSALWQKLAAHLSGRLDAQRARNDGDLSPEDTQKLRGRIAQLKEILALAREPVQVDGDAQAPLSGE